MESESSMLGSEPVEKIADTAPAQVFARNAFFPTRFLMVLLASAIPPSALRHRPDARPTASLDITTTQHLKPAKVARTWSAIARTARVLVVLPARLATFCSATRRSLFAGVTVLMDSLRLATTAQLSAIRLL